LLFRSFGPNRLSKQSLTSPGSRRGLSRRLALARIGRLAGLRVLTKVKRKMQREGIFRETAFLTSTGHATSLGHDTRESVIRLHRMQLEWLMKLQWAWRTTASVSD